MKYLYVVGDTNDADYATSLVKISKKDLKIISPLLEAIKNFKPYKTKTQDGLGDWTHRHNFNNGELRDDLGEKHPEDIYVQSGLVTQDTFDCFSEDYCPCGIHSITS